MSGYYPSSANVFSACVLNVCHWTFATIDVLYMPRFLASDLAEMLPDNRTCYWATLSSICVCSVMHADEDGEALLLDS